MAEPAATRPRRDQAALRALPSVDEMLRSDSGLEAVRSHGRAAATAAARDVLTKARSALQDATDAPDRPSLTAAMAARLDEAARPNLRTVFNLTGTVLHTNLGRAVLAEAAIDAATRAMREAVALEFDLKTGQRGERDALVRELLCELTGAEDATVLNNNAAALMIVLNTLARDKDSIVSRGELIEIGGAFRLPDIMERAGTRLVEVGTTNRTHPRDYEAAIGPETGLLLKVHTSNFLIQGFTAAVEPKRLAAIAGAASAPFVNDLGSGTLLDLRRIGLAHEPTVAEAVAEGADLVTFSGDKLLGGPQAGFVVGRADLVRRINKNPMKRAMRVDKIRLAAIEATLRLYRHPETLAERLPTMRHLSRTPSEIDAVAGRMLPALRRALEPSFALDVVPCDSQIGSGALPLSTLASRAIRIAPTDDANKRGRSGALDRLAAAFRALPRPVIGRIADGALLLDCRCLEDEDSFAANLTVLLPELSA